MLKNYFKIAIRTLIKNKTYSFINIMGLSISLAVFFLMFLWIKDEYNTDKFHNKSEQLFRLKGTTTLEANTLNVSETVSYPLLKAAVEELPEVQKWIPLGRSFEDNLRIQDKHLRARGTFTNNSFFESFSYPILIGDASQLDKKLESIVISESLAKIIFGDEWQSKALGTDLEILDNGNFVIDAVYKDFPSNSSLQNDFYYSFEKHLNDNSWLLEWGNTGMQGALLLSKNADHKLVSKKLENIFQSNLEGDLIQSCFLQKYEDDYLYAQFDERAEVVGGRIEYVKTFGLAALLLLLISCINFVNLATVLATKRAKEVGIRKTVGASKKMLISQFMVEAYTLTLISICISLGIAWILLPEVNNLSNKALSLDLMQPHFIKSVIGIFGLTTLLAGAYPAFVLSSFEPVSALKSKGEKIGAGISIRKALVIVQFGLSLMLIISAVVVQQQINFIQNKNLGISKDNLIAIHQDKYVTENYEILYNELIHSEGIKDVTLIGPSPLDIQAASTDITWPGKREDQANVGFSIVWTGQNFTEVFDIPMKAGVYYREGQIIDSTNIVFNESAIEIMGLTDPIGKTIQWWGEPRQIVGIVKDFHNQSLHQKIKPTTFLLDANDAGTMYVKTEEGMILQAIATLESTFKKVIPSSPFHYEFLDQQYQELYASELLTGILASYFATISIFISCLGLFGLITFIGQQRSKEISIRKILGANVASIVSLLSKDFMKLIFIAIIIAFPVGWYLTNEWLQGFEYKVNVQWWIFAGAGFMAVIIALVTISFQAIKAAVANPVKSLRSE